MAAVWARSRAELQARWRAMVLLAVLIGLAGGVVLAAVAGARRTATVMDRFLAYHRPTNVEIGTRGLDPDAVRRLPMVADVAQGGYLAMVAALPSGGPDADAFGEINPFVGLGEWPGASNRPILVAGRLPFGDRPLEVAVDELLAARRNVRPGDTLRMWGYTPEQVERAKRRGVDGLTTPEGDAYDLTVTGLVRTPYDLAPVPAGQDVVWLGSEELYLTPAFWRASRGRVAVLGTGVELRLRHGLADLDAFTTAVHGLPGGSSVQVYTNSDAERTVLRLGRAVRLEVVAQLVFAGLATVTALFIVGQAIARQVQLDAPEHGALRAIGMTSGQLMATVLLRGVLVGAGGALLAVALAVALSPLTPIGLARRAEVAPGVAADAPVVLLGAAAVLLVVLARTGLAAWAVTRASGQAASGRPATRTSRVGDRLAGAGGPPSAVLGARLAFESGSGGAVPARTAAIGAVVAVVAIAAAITFGASLDRLTTTPALQGWTWDVMVGDPRGPLDGADQIARRLTTDPLVAGVSSLATPPDQRVVIDGVKQVALGFDQLQGAVLPPVLQGRQARSADELALGPATLQSIGRQIGDVVEVVAGDRRNRMRIVGTTLLQSRLHNDLTLDTGALLTSDGLRALRSDTGPSLFLVEYAPGVDPDRAFLSLQRDFGRIVMRPMSDEEVENLARVGGLPYLLAGLLAVLGVGTVGHMLVTSVRHRRRDLAVLKALGFVRGQVRATVAWQATDLALLALVVGLPLGIAAGRWAWLLVNGDLHSLAGPVTPTIALLAAVPVTVLVANLVAALPARVAAATRPAVVLRSE